MVPSWCMAGIESKAAKTQFQHLSPRALATVQAGTNRREVHVVTADLPTTLKDRPICQLFSVYLATVPAVKKACFKAIPAGAAGEVWHGATSHCLSEHTHVSEEIFHQCFKLHKSRSVSQTSTMVEKAINLQATRLLICWIHTEMKWLQMKLILAHLGEVFEAVAYEGISFNLQAIRTCSHHNGKKKLLQY